MRPAPSRQAPPQKNIGAGARHFGARGALKGGGDTALLRGAEKGTKIKVSFGGCREGGEGGGLQKSSHPLRGKNLRAAGLCLLSRTHLSGKHADAELLHVFGGHLSVKRFKEEEEGGALLG